MASTWATTTATQLPTARCHVAFVRWRTRTSASGTMTAPITTRVSSDGLVMDKVASPDLILGVIKGALAGGTMKNIWKPRAA